MKILSCELNFELFFTKNPYLTIVIGDFNVQLYNWYTDYKTAVSQTKVEIITSQFRRTQMINEPASILEDAATCIDLIFKSHPNMDQDLIIRAFTK